MIPEWSNNSCIIPPITINGRLMTGLPPRRCCSRGAESDLLLPEWAQDMTRRGPACTLAEWAGIGHAPALNVAEQLDVLTAFLAD